MPAHRRLGTFQEIMKELNFILTLTDYYDFPLDTYLHVRIFFFLFSFWFHFYPFHSFSFYTEGSGHQSHTCILHCDWGKRK